MDPASPDARLSNYRLERLLGSGGMGSVYLAHDLALDRRVAIKFITAGRAGDESSRRRLIREARAAAALDHPNICGVHEVVVDPDGRACIVMQYVEGETLAEKLRSGPLDVRLALSVASDVAAALAAADERHLIHRDVKPQNIIITTTKQAKLLDFGLATQSHGGDQASVETTTTNLTNPGVVVGTLPYMSPEQLENRPLDGRSDLFSLGVVLFECFTGQRPFAGQSPAETASRILHHDPPPVSSLRAGLTEHHDELCRRLLAKHPDDRFQSAAELLAALSVFSGGVIPLRPAPRPLSRRWLQFLAASVIILILAGAGVWKWKPAPVEFVASADARRMYERGVEAVRDGAYSSGRRALESSVAIAPGFVPAYVRLAEACSELDDHRCAQDALNTVGTLTPDEGTLLVEDRLRVRAVRALMLRRVDDMVSEYVRLTELHPTEAGAWVDLGRAQETAARPVEALRSFDRAIELEPADAAAHLRRATLTSQLGERAEPLREFEMAENLYRTREHVEGQIEALLRRGTYLNGLGDLKPAREALERAATLAQTLENHEQLIRAQLQLSGVTASEGEYGKAQQIASRAVDLALSSDLDTVAADGLIDLANALLQARINEAPDPSVFQSIDTYLERSIKLAEGRNAQRIVARGRMQQAALLTHFKQPEKGLEILDKVLVFLKANNYRRYELRALLIKSRTLQALGKNDQGRPLSEECLALAERVQDDSAAAFALENLAGFAADEGDFPAAEAFRARGETIDRRQRNDDYLPYGLANRAELLILLGRGPDADPLLVEVDEGIAKGIESYKGRQRRVKVLRALRAAVEGRFTDGVRLAGELVGGPDGTNDSSGKLAAALQVYAGARLGRRISEPVWEVAERAAAAPAHEARYWTLYARLISGHPRATLTGADDALTNKEIIASPELEWRMAALGAAAAKVLSDADRASALSKKSADARGRLRSRWKAAVAAYERRPDLIDLARRSGL